MEALRGAGAESLAPRRCQRGLEIRESRQVCGRRVGGVWKACGERMEGVWKDASCRCG